MAIADVESMEPVDTMALSDVRQLEELPEPSSPLGLRVVETEIVNQLTGSGSPNATDARWNVHGTDLGHMFTHKGELYMVFGDTYGPDGEDWRSNTIARIADPDPANGFSIAAMIESATGAAKEIIRSAKVPGLEWTVIPTNGISLGERMVLHYMSVRMWGADDKWYVRRSGLAYSDDDGQNWTRSETAMWPAGTGFEQVAYVESEGMIYVFGIPQGRFGGVRLGRVTPQHVFDPTAYTYWDGQGWLGNVHAAKAIVPAPAGELSVAWSDAHQSWLMMYLEPVERAVILRSAPTMTGPWSDAQIVAHADEYPGLYAPYIVPGLDIDDAVYFTMSRWKPVYNVFLMKGKLEAPVVDLAAVETTGIAKPDIELDQVDK
ncbi:DUF4185 domain-containing protein [uncultured Tateyamaria sp.]|nr:DUF4185 domain-containing protein [uncultured Tateyamaria sp.]